MEDCPCSSNVDHCFVTEGGAQVSCCICYALANPVPS